VNDALVRALELSFWAKLPREAVEKLFAEGLPMDAPAGLTIPDDEGHGRLGLVMNGLVRMFVKAKSGRQVTVAYLRCGDLLGLTSALAGPCKMGCQALTPASFWVISAESLKRHSLQNAALAWGIAEESARRTYDMVDEVADNTFGTVRQRVARHLLDLVIEAPEGGELVAPISQQELANAVGTAREVVSRVLVAFRNEGLVRTGTGGVEVLDATRLFESSQVAD
jgi:CRP/FNR family cyclic AMP-dependent transcriptional regulator